MKKLEYSVEGKSMLFAERDADSVVGSRRLQFEIEALAEALAQGKAPCAVDARSERRVQDELHSARFIEESFRHHGIGGGHRPEGRSTGPQIGDRLPRAGFVESA